MSTELPDDDAPSREEIADTWRWKQDAASWLANLAFPGGDVAAANRWIAGAIAGLLGDFTALARVRTAMLLDDDARSDLTKGAEEPYAQLRTRLLDAIAGHPRPLTDVELGLDLQVWVRTIDCADRPSLAWLSYPGTALALHVIPAEGRAWIEFSISNTLFSAFTYPDKDPNPLHSLNQPLLEAALRRLRARATDPLDRAGELRGADEFGFSSDPDDY
jgi:hypothetical protein